MGAARPRRRDPGRPDRRPALAASLDAWASTLPDGSCFTGLTAARIHGLWLPPLPADLRLAVALPAGAVRRRPGHLRVTRHPHPIASTASPGGVRVATVPETLLACAAVVDLLDLLVLVDGALHLGRCTREEVEGIARQRRRGAPLLRRALARCSARSESAWETLLRVLHEECGVPVQPQVVIDDPSGHFIARADLLIEGTRTLQEYDGEHHRGAGQYRRDRRRDAALALHGYVRHGWVAADVISGGWRIYAAACEALGRQPDFNRLSAWESLLADSLFTAEGHRRWTGR